MSDLWTVGIPLGEKVLRTVVVYGGLVVLLRFAGKRNLAQLNSFDLIVALLLASVVQNVLIGPDDSLAGGLLAAVVLLVTNALVVRLVRCRSREGRCLRGPRTSPAGTETGRRRHAAPRPGGRWAA